MGARKKWAVFATALNLTESPWALFVKMPAKIPRSKAAKGAGINDTQRRLSKTPITGGRRVSRDAYRGSKRDVRGEDAGLHRAGRKNLKL